MRKAMKRSLSLLLAITIIFSSAYVGLSEVDFGSLFAVKAKAATSGTTGDCTWSLDGTVLTISGNGMMDCNSSPWGTTITEIVIEDGVTAIGHTVFSGCTKLTSIRIPDSVTTIGMSAFSDCTSLASITIPDSVTCIDSYAFGNTAYYNNVYNWVGEVLYIGNHLIKAKTSITGNYMVKEGIKTIANSAFDDCSSLISITIPDSVKNIGFASFYDCKNLKDVYYKESEVQWAKIYVDLHNDCLLNANIHYNSSGSSGNFGQVDIQKMVEDSTVFEIKDKTPLLEGEIPVAGSGELNLAINNATVKYNSTEKKLNSNTHVIKSSELIHEITFTAPDFYNYIIPATVAGSLNENSKGKVSVYMTKDRKDGKPYISTVFGRLHYDENDDFYEELQSNSLYLLKGSTYDIVITAQLKGETSATYYLSQDSEHRISSKTGMFSNADLYDEFVKNRPIYAYAVTSSGKVTEPVAINLKKSEDCKALNTLLSSPKISLLGPGSSNLTIDNDIPVVGGAEISMDFLELPVGVEVEGDRVRISFGLDLFELSTENGKAKEYEWINFKNICKEMDDISKEIDDEINSANNLINKSKEYQKALKGRRFDSLTDKTKKTGIDIDATYLGYIEGYVIDGNLIFTEFLGTFAAEFIAKYTVNSFIGPVPVYLYVNGGVEIAGAVDIARTIPDENIPIQFDTTFSFNPKVKIGGGVGTKGVCSAGIYGKAEIPAVYEFIDKHLTIALSGEIGVEGEFLIWGNNFKLFSGKVNVVDEYLGTKTASLSNFSQEVYSQTANIMYSDNSDFECSLVSRDYANSTSEWQPINANTTDNISGMQTPVYGSASSPKVTVVDLQTSVYKNSQTQFVQFGDKVMLAYIEDCTGRDTYNRYRLMYTIYNPSTNSWTTPKAVYDSGKMDMAPCLATDGESVYIAWQTVNTKVTSATEDAMYKAMNNMEIYSAEYDQTSGSFVNVIRHTNNSTYDYSPYVTVENGSATVYWVNAASNNFAAGEMSIHSSENSSKTLIYDDMNYVTSVKACGNDISYSMDIDGDISTVSDIKLFTNGVQVGEAVVTESSVITNFVYGDFNGKETLFYSDGGTVYSVDNGTSFATFTAPGGIADSLHVTNLNGKPAVIYTQLTDMGSELCVSVLENGVWSEPVYLTDIGCALSNVDVVSVNGKVYVVFNKTHTTKITDENTGDINLEYGQTDLGMLTSSGYYDLEISNIGFNESDMSIGSAAPVIVVMENKGTETINNVKFTVSDTLGYSKSITKNVKLAPGAIESVELDYSPRTGYKQSDLTITATIVGYNDIDTSNNTATEQIGRTDISVGEISVERIGDVYNISCEISNDSLIAAEDVSAIISFDGCKKNVNVGSIAANDSYIVELFVSKEELVFNENDICTLTFSASTNSEEVVLTNNENTVTVDNSEKSEEHKHNFVDGFCASCGIPGSTIVDSGTCGENITWKLDDAGVLTISGTGDMTDYNYRYSSELGFYSDSPFYKSNEIISVVLTNGITSIGSYIFTSCTNLTSITIPDTVTSIGNYAFYKCSSLKTIAIPESVKSIGFSAFDSCVSLTAINIPSGVRIIDEYTFNKCTSLKSIVIPNSVTSIGNCAFSDCVNLSSIIIPDSVKYVGIFAFEDTAYYNDSSKWVNNVLYIGNHLIEAKDTISGSYSIKNGTKTIGGYAFDECTNLTAISIPDSIVFIGYGAFIDCESLGSVVIPKNVTNISIATFQRCSKMTSVTIPNNVKSIGQAAFYDCNNLERVTISNNVTYIGDYAFGQCYNLDTVLCTSSKFDVSSKTIDNGNGYLLDATWYYNYDPTKPATPKVTTTNEIGGVQVKWNAVAGATKYVVYRRQGGYNTWVNVGTTTGNTLLDKNVKSGIYYVYSVRAYNSSGQYSDFVSANTQTRKYMATPKLTTIYNHVNGLAIKWNAVSGVTNGYRVYRRGAGSTYWTYLGTTKNLYFIDSQVKNRNGEYFRYTVIADGGYHSKFDTTGLYLRRLANPTLTSAVSSTAGIIVKWGAIKGTTGYYVYRKTANSTWVRVAAIGGTYNTTFLDKTAKKGTTYTYTVRAVYGATTSAYNSGISCYDKY